MYLIGLVTLVAILNTISNMIIAVIIYINVNILVTSSAFLSKSSLLTTDIIFHPVLGEIITFNILSIPLIFFSMNSLLLMSRCINASIFNSSGVFNNHSGSFGLTKILLFSFITIIYPDSPIRICSILLVISSILTDTPITPSTSESFITLFDMLITISLVNFVMYGSDITIFSLLIVLTYQGLILGS